jgi:hypothetical protein
MAPIRIEALRRAVSRMAIVAIAVLLAIGLALAWMGSAGSGTALVPAMVLLLAVPVVNVSAVLLEEIHRRDWPFVVAAVLVLALVALGIVEKLR